MLNKDYKEILSILIKRDVRFLIIGAYALGAHGYPRSTGDFDLWVEASQANASKSRMPKIDIYLKAPYNV
jgi:hypothetical protein